MKIKELNKEQKVIIVLVIVLICVFGTMQTNISIKKINIKNLNLQIEQLENENKKLNDDLLYNKSNNKNQIVNEDEQIVTEIVSNDDKLYIEVKNRFLEAAKNMNKEFNEDLEGKSIISIDVMNLTDLTDNQISKNIERLESEKFNISIEKKKMGKSFFYRINLLI